MNAETETATTARTLLFVPGDRADRFDKARSAGADGIVLDLEDAVAPAMKENARDSVARWRSVGGRGLVRINDSRSPWYDEDVNEISRAPCVVMLPKATNAQEIERLWARLPAGSGVIPLLENAEGILNARAVCGAAGVLRVGFGNGDLACELGISHADRQALLFARCMVVLASSAAGIAPPLDGVTTTVTDAEQIGDDARHAASLGFTGKLCIHPRQVPIVHAGFVPSEDELSWAQNVLRVAAHGAVALADGAMIDKPIIERARQIVERAGR